MIRRWPAPGLFRAGERFRRIKGHRELPKVIAALRGAELETQVAKTP